tara:strand:+ start:80 stop:1213 length:1134 start_codon:yes stop_codon:yes gene_type:complete
MEKIIFRKFLYDLVTFFLLVSLSLSLITWIIQSVNYLDFISKDGHGFKVYFAFILLNFPKIFSKLIIFSYFISIFYIIQKYKLNNEILIFWTNGISKLKLVNFIIKTSIIFTIFQILFVFFLVPKFQDYSRDYIRTSNVDFFTSLITEKKFIDTVKDFTIFVDDIDDAGNMENIYIKDSVNKISKQIISAKSGKIIEKGSEKFLYLSFGQILDISNNNIGDSKIIKFNNTIFNLSNFKTKSTTFPKFQELDSEILLYCIHNFSFGKRTDYSLPIFHCSKDSSLKSGKEIFKRSIKQTYIILIAAIACLLIFIDEKDVRFNIKRILIFSACLLGIILAEVNSELLSFSFLNNIFSTIIPLGLFVISYLYLINLNQKNI